MNTNKNNKRLLGIGIVTAIASSLCCITPVLALIAGTGGLASTFSWIEPARPYLIGITVLVLGVAWYLKLKPIKQEDCDCEVVAKSSFFQSKSFLALVTVMAVIMTLFPYYSEIFYSQNINKTVVVQESKILEITIPISGMSCTACENHVNHAIGKLNGIINVTTSYPKANTIVRFDKSKTDSASIIQTINSTGYKAINNE